MRGESTGLRVLVIEDEMMVAMGLELALADAGYEVIGPFGRLNQAIDAARNEEVDVALLDVNLREDETFPVADILSARGVPYAFLTGYGRETLPSRFHSERVLSKPFHGTQLVAAVKELAALTSSPTVRS